MFFVLSKLVFLFLRPSNLIVLLLFAGVVLRHLDWPRFGAAVGGLGLVLLVACGWGGVSTIALWPLENRFPASPPLAGPPTGIIVLGGAIDTDLSSGHGSIEFTDGAERVIAATELARDYPNARLVYTGGSGSLFGGAGEAEFGRRLFTLFGIAPERIEIESASRNTRENAAFTRDLVRPKPGETWLLVTSAYHMPRAVAVFRRAGWTGLVPWPVDFRTSPQDTVLGGRYAADGLFLTDIAIKEWVGLLAYRFAGYTDEVLPAPVAAGP